MNIGALALSNWYTEREKIALFHSVECNGTEESIFDCRTNEGDGGCGTYQDASVICHGIFCMTVMDTRPYLWLPLQNNITHEDVTKGTGLELCLGACVITH